MRSPFLIKVLNAAGAVLGNGPLTTVTQLSDTRNLDSIGSISFSFPANEPMYALITEGSQFDVYDEVDGYIGRYVFLRDDLRESKQRGIVTIRCDSVLQELVNIPLGFRRRYDYDPVEDVVASLIGSAPGWGSDIETGIGNTTVTFEGETVLSGLRGLASRWGVHYRLTGAKTLQFGRFGLNSGVVVTNLEGQVQPMIAARDYMAMVDTIGRTRDGDWIVNTVIATGAGQGINQLTLEGAITGLYPVLTFPNFDGTNTAYIQDAASVAAYGQRLHQVSFPQITPIANTIIDVQRAKEALKLTTEVYMIDHLNPRTEYTLTVIGLRKEVKVGDKVRLRYQGTDRATGVYLDVDDDFYVMSITRNRSATGKRGASLTIASVNKVRRDDTDVMVDVIGEVKALKVYYQPTNFRFENTQVDTIAQVATNGLGQAYNKHATFTLVLDNTITSVSSVRLRWSTLLLDVPVEIGAGVGVGVQQLYVWQLVTDYNYPKRIRLIVDGTDVTDQFGGPWNASDENAGVLDIECDITSLIPAYALHSPHTIELACGDPVDDAETRVSLGHPSLVTNYHSHGRIQMTFIVQGSSTGVKVI